jgi:4-amino-4-deoxy-L-arabinose transferase-like glycosyltransferase
LSKTSERALILFVLLLAFALRLYGLDAQSLWYDEAVSAQVAAKGMAELTRWTADDIQPPLYYYVIAAWTRAAGDGEWALRFPSAAFGALTVALLWSLARRIFRPYPFARLAAALASLFAAASPLYVYYGQEARMYTQLTFLAALAAYSIWRAAERPRAWAWWATFVVASAAALYTHYFALFWLVALGLIALGPAWRRRALLPLAVSALAIAALYLPWLPAMLNRYRVDASYWQGALKLDEALRHVAIHWTTGATETMLEGDAVRWLPWFAAALLAAAVGLFLVGKHDRSGKPARSSFALLALLVAIVVPVALALLLASRNPKFNPRYLMLASPAYLLLLAGGAAAWWHTSGRPRWIGRALATVIVAIVLVSSAVAVRNWYSDPAFTKAQWREVAATVRERIGPNERIVLVSGHAAPAWDYYAPDMPAARLPDIDILDVNAVLGFPAAEQLGAALEGRDGAWLVTWQDEVVDPLAVAPYLLDRAGSEQPVDRSFWRVGLRHWKLDADASFPTAPSPEQPQTANFDHKLALLGWDAPHGGELTVYWQAINSLPADYQVSLIFEDASGVELARWDGRPAAYNFPTTRWRVGEPVLGRYPVPIEAGASGGRYATIAVYSQDAPEGLDVRDQADNPAGKRVRIGPF